eukprot:gnl/TRDRNA2_/TRDRNA2_36444_c0_seq1.p1 gnl/TRDRNA2_/TRDRNA2_36444_c0~~gnl/TRDRNA2_/TRDRNA2_36444_c0_seq1.p1  ORF type:complete len:702 (+),score=111.45 gnl/TRDRNA2_/TRDRNA2_36444_c0_seq1:152-2107(+)
MGDDACRGQDMICAKSENFVEGGGFEMYADASNPDELLNAKQCHLVLDRHRLCSPHLQCRLGDYYQTTRKIGEGSYGNVYEAVVRPVNAATGKPARGGENVAGTADSKKTRLVAVKAFMLGKVSDQDRDRSLRDLTVRRASFEVERKMLSLIEHPHIVRMYECFEEKNALYVVLELCRGGELYERIAAKAREAGGGGLAENTARSLFRQMLCATSYLHARKIVHRDIKTENFLLLGEKDSPEAEVIKLCDFGTAVHLSPQKPRSMERIGTLSYTAPEIYANRGADVAADAWSLGVVLYVILVGASPFRTSEGDTKEETMRRIQRGQFEQRRSAWQALSEEARDLVQKFLIIEEPKRLSSGEALRHDWVTQGTSDSMCHITQYNTPGAKIAAAAQPMLNALVRFTQLDALQQLVLVVCAQVTSEVDVLREASPVPWYEAFWALDTNEDGCLDFAELTQGLKLLLGAENYLTDGQMESLVRTLDLDDSGSIEWVEWVAVALLALGGLTEDLEPLSTAFRLLDRPSCDGTIGAADLLAVVSSDGSDSCLSTSGREQVIRILQRWAPLTKHSQSRSSSSSTSPPSLALPDVRRVLECVLWDRTEETLPQPRVRSRPLSGTNGVRLWERCVDGSQRPKASGRPQGETYEIEVVPEK